MGIRMDQDMGLNAWTEDLVAGEQVLAYTSHERRVYPDGREEIREPTPAYSSSVKAEPSGETYAGMFDAEYPLQKYTLPDGKVFWEVVQAAPWSSGPVFFLALSQFNKGEREQFLSAGASLETLCVKESLWSEKEIDHA